MESVMNMITKRFSTENIEVGTLSHNDGELVSLHEASIDGLRPDPIAVVYVKEYELKVAWFRQAQLSDYQRNRFEFQLSHLVRDYDMKAQQYKRIHGGG